MNLPDRNSIDTLAARHRPGLALEQPFYCDAAVFERDVERLFLNDWLYAGHVSQLPEPGSWLVYDIAGESAIVSRDAGGALRAMVNVCRHRGSRICSEGHGKARRFVCPYHGWTYELDGALARARGMPAEFDAAAHRLHPLALEEFHGMIFVSFAERPASLDTARAFDGGASDGQMGLLCYWLVYSDHCVVYRFTPRDVNHTDMDIVWLVRSDAMEDRDYDLERLTWLWHVTTKADKLIIERNQQGVRSRFYRPGPYAPMEWASRQLVDWYLL